jgi:uncharacterized membrane protein YgcG
VKEYELLAAECVLTHRGERHFFAPQGAAGGEPGAMAQSPLHQNLAALFGERPSLAVELLRSVLGDAVPAYERITVLPEGSLDPQRVACDAIVVLESKGRVLAVILVEVQLRRDKQKRFSWPVYVAVARRAYGCPVHLLVLTTNAAVARWAEQPILLGDPQSVVTPTVIGPSRVPRITDPAVAMQAPELALLSVMAHASEPDVAPVVAAALRALAEVDEGRVGVYHDLLLAALRGAAHRPDAALRAPAVRRARSVEGAGHRECGAEGGSGAGARGGGGAGARGGGGARCAA